MQPSRLVLTLLILVAAPLAQAQTEPPPPPASPAPIPMPRIRFADPHEAAEVAPSPDVTEVPPADDFVVIPLRAHILSATDLSAVECHLTDEDIQRVVGKMNGIWHRAGIHWALAPIIHEAAAHQDEFRQRSQQAGANNLGIYRQLAPEDSKGDEGADVYYIHAFPVNGVFFGDRTAFVQETARLRAVPGGIDEPLPRVTAHELGHALGLPHRQARTNLLASGTTGTILNQAEVDSTRARAARYPGALTVPDLRRRLAAAKARDDGIEAARLDTILNAIPVAKPASTP